MDIVCPFHYFPKSLFSMHSQVPPTQKSRVNGLGVKINMKVVVMLCYPQLNAGKVVLCHTNRCIKSLNDRKNHEGNGASLKSECD